MISIVEGSHANDRSDDSLKAPSIIVSAMICCCFWI